MNIENILYPGFNRSLAELKAIKKIKKNSIELVDFTEIEWVRDVLKHRFDEVGDYKLKFLKPSEDEINQVSKLVGADISGDTLKNNFHKNKRIIGITSGKGGVGKSTVTSLLGIAFDELGKKVGILDSDIWGFSIPKILGAKFPPIPFNERIFPSKINNLSVISMEYFVKQDEAVIWRGPMLHKAIEQFLFEVLWQDIDILLIDMPPGTGDVQLTLAQKIPVSGAIIVTTPQDIALLDARKGLKMFEKVEVPVLGIVENMSIHICSKCGNEESIFGEGGGSSLAKENEVDLLGKLPLDISIREQTDTGKPSVVFDPEGRIAEIYGDIARKAAGKLSAQSKDYSAKFPKIVIDNN